MGTMKGQVLSSATKLFDLVLLMGSFAVAVLPHLRASGSISLAQFLGLKIKLGDIVIFSSLLGIWILIFTILGLYGSKRLASRRSEAFDVVKATTLCAAVLGLASFLLQFQWVTPSFVAIFWACSTFVIVSTRMAVRTWLRRLRMHGRDSRNMLIVGSNRRAIEFARKIQSKPELGYRILGFADAEWAGIGELERQGWPLVCGLGDLRTFLRRSVVDEVVLTVPLRSFHDLASDVAAMCEQQGIVVRVLSDLFNLQHRQAKAEEFAGAPLITHSSGITEGWPSTIKRTLDFTLSLLLLIALAPLLLLTAILISLTSAGPVFFVQRRIGLNKRVFYIYKFRTMVVNAEEKMREVEHLNELSGPVFKIKNDPRLTSVGRFLRKTSIDELPQLFNVLCGDMSLVGPRPLAVRDYELFTEAGHDWQRCRFSVRPGITCLWQVSGRNSLPFHQWMELDLQYVRGWSLWLDLQILARTIPAVLRGSGAA
ncbi:MAG: sugar transferase [Acidobacteriia bacterium]|nr:sugar transferase [Terriglobia bacterium]